MKPILLSMTLASMGAAVAAAQPPHFTLTDLGAVGGAPGQAYSIAHNGLMGGAATAADGTSHATLWYKGAKADISEPGLGGRNSLVFSVNERGLAVGGAESTITTNPISPNATGADFCGFKAMGLPTKPGAACVAFAWQYGMMTELPNLGGSNSEANGVNNRDVIAGVAESSKTDPDCPAPQVLQFSPVIWDREGIHELPRAAGDPDGVALAVNDVGQVAGGSGACSSFNFQLLFNLQPLHALLWDTGTVTDLGNLGGPGKAFGGHIALALNNNGQVVGSSDLPDDQSSHAFLWTKETGMQDLGTLPGDSLSAGIAINDAGTVVGVSLDSDFNLRGFYWQNGTMSDLNDLIPANSNLAILLPCSINPRGEIVGLAVDKSTGEGHAFLLTPSAGTPADNGSAANDTPVSEDTHRARPALTDDVRRLLMRLAGRYAAIR